MNKNWAKANIDIPDDGRQYTGQEIKACFCGRNPSQCRLYAKNYGNVTAYDCKSASCGLGSGGFRTGHGLGVFMPAPDAQNELSVHSIELPSGYIPAVPENALKWHLENGGVESDISEYKIGWDVETNRLIYPVYSAEGLETWLGRDIGGTHPCKWLTPKGVKNSPVFTSVVPQNRSVGVIVEDVLSAMRVGRLYPACAILGTSANNERLGHILRWKRTLGLSKLCVALDDDADHQAFKLIKQLTGLGIIVYIKRYKLNKDPKLMTDNELIRIVTPKMKG